MTRGSRMLLGAALLAVSGCQGPPPDVYVTAGAARQTALVPVGNNAVGEACRYRLVASDQAAIAARQAADVLCGSWEQPSGRIFELGGSDAVGLQRLATTGPWRAYVDERFTCQQPVPTQLLDDSAALLLQCNRRSGGWPHLALAASIGGHVFLADGVGTALPAIEATLAVLSGRRAVAAAGPQSAARRLIAAGGAEKAFGSGDEGRYHALIALGDAYNNVDDWAHAERAFRDALAVQQRFLKPDNPGLALTMMKLAAQLGHQRETPEADRLLERAAVLTARASDPLLAAQLRYYRAVTAAYQGDAVTALREVAAAQQAFAALAPEVGAARRWQPGAAGGALARSPIRGTGGGAGALVDQLDAALLRADASIDAQAATRGLAESLRLQASLTRQAGDVAGSTALARRADELLAAAGLELSSTGARALRLAAGNEATGGNYAAAGGTSTQAGGVFQQVVPGERPDALNALDAGAYRLRRGDTDGALKLFREAGAILRNPTVVAGAPAGSIYPWLDLLYAEGERHPAERPRLNAEMFEAAQLAKSSLVAQDIAQAAARLAASDPKVGAVLQQLQQRERQFASLARQRDAVVASEQTGGGDQLKRLDSEIVTAQKRLADAESETQEAAPRYRQTIEQPVTEAEISKLVQPDEALVSIFVAPQGSYGFLIDASRILTYRIPLGQNEFADLVQKLRDSVLPKSQGGRSLLPNYDTGTAYRLYAVLIAPVEHELDGKKRLIVAPSGALLSFPWEALVTAPKVTVNGVDYRQVPWLVRRFAMSFVPAPRTFVDLRRIKGAAPGPYSYMGFGDFKPPTERQIEALFPTDRCAEDERNLRSLGPLPGTKIEVATVGRAVGAASNDIVLGAAFTKARLTTEDLSRYRIIHLATHSLLPAALGKCQTEPAILTSVQASAASADAGFLRPGDIEKLKLNADLVVLSACDTAGAADGGGESLSGLARAFFRAGTRGALVTHWPTLDLVAMRLMTAALAGRSKDTAIALRDAELQLIDAAGSTKELPMLFSAPFAWAPFVLIGDGVRGGGAEIVMGTDGRVD